MPSALYNNEATLEVQSRQMEEVRKKERVVSPADDNSIAPKARKPHKQSLDYIWRTGVAGGLAGSAVRLPLPHLQSNTNILRVAGENCSRSTRSR